MTKNERERAIKEGHKIHAETSYFTPRPQLDFVNARYVFCEGFDRGYIAATTEADKRIAELENEGAEWKERVANYDRWLSGGVYYTNDESFKLHNNYNNKIADLQASNNNLREALNMLVITKDYKDKQGKDAVYETMRTNAWNVAEQALSANPTESLKEVK